MKGLNELVVLGALSTLDMTAAFTTSPCSKALASSQSFCSGRMSSSSRYHPRARISLQSMVDESKKLKEADTSIGKIDSKSVEDEIEKNPLFLMFSSETGQYLLSICLVTGSLIGQVGVLFLAIAIAEFLQVPNNGLGDYFLLNFETVQLGAMSSLILITGASLVKIAENYISSVEVGSREILKDILIKLGGNRKPLLALISCLSLGLTMGITEEYIFRGILQAELGQKLGDTGGVLLTGGFLAFLQRASPVRATFIFFESLYFGYLYLANDGNLVVPMVCHALFYIWAFLTAHFVVTEMEEDERKELANWEPTGSTRNGFINNIVVFQFLELVEGITEILGLQFF